MSDYRDAAPPDPGTAVEGIPAPHVDYPHHPGTLYDCQGCELGPCVCAGDFNAECVSDQCLNKEMPNGARMPAYFDGPITNGGFGE